MYDIDNDQWEMSLTCPVQMRDRAGRVHQAAALQPQEIKLLPLHDPVLRQVRKYPFAQN